MKIAVTPTWHNYSHGPIRWLGIWQIVTGQLLVDDRHGGCAERQAGQFQGPR